MAMRLTRGLYARITKFSIVGVINTLVDVGVLNLLVIALGFQLYFTLFGVRIVAANLISVSAAIINSYLLNKFWTFRRRGGNSVRREAVLFIVISLVGMVINTAVLSLLYFHWQWPADMVIRGIRELGFLSSFSDEFFLLNVSKALALATSMTWNFYAYSRWTFPKKKSAEKRESDACLV